MLHRSALIIVVVLACACPLVAQRRRAVPSRRVIPVCSIPTDAEKLVGFDIKFSVLRDTEVIHARDIDFVAWAIDFGPATNPVQLKAFSGLNVGNGEPSREDIAASRKFTRRYWTHNRRGGADSRGALKNGRLWRTFGMFGEVVWYYNVPADAAAYFDRILDTACFIN